MTYQKKRLKKIDVSILGNLSVILYENGRMKKTVLSRKANMGYDKCVRYLNQLEVFDFVNRRIDDEGYETIGLTSNGVKYCKKICEMDDVNTKSEFEEISENIII